jgi:hypothetical protein
VTALSDIPIQGKMLIAAVGPWWCRHREEMIYTCTYSEMRILQLIVSGTLANAGRPERVINKQNKHLFSELRLLVVNVLTFDGIPNVVLEVNTDEFTADSTGLVVIEKCVADTVVVEAIQVDTFCSSIPFEVTLIAGINARIVVLKPTAGKQKRTRNS